MPDETDSQVKGVYTLTDSDIIAINDIEQAKRTILLNINNLNEVALVDQLKDLFAYMQTILEKYFDQDVITKQKTLANDGISYNFYELKILIPQATKSKDLIRVICELAYTNYNLLIKRIGVAIPTTRRSWQSKLIERLYATAIKSNPDTFISHILAKYKATGCQDTPLNLYCFCLSDLANYDLDSTNLDVGKRRSGKSVLLCEIMRRFYGFRLGKINNLNEVDKYLIDRQYAKNNIIYDKKQDLKNMVLQTKKDFYATDEAYLTADKRRSMTLGNIELSHTYNVYADQNHAIFTLIQNAHDLDQRITQSASSLLLVLARGRALLFSSQNSFAIIKTFFGFERFLKNPDLLAGLESGIYHLKRLKSFICEIEWQDLQKLDKTGKQVWCNPFFKTYLENKALWHSESEQETESEQENAPDQIYKQPVSAEVLSQLNPIY